MERKRTSARGGSSSARAQRGGKSASAGRGNGSSTSKRVIIAWEDALRDSDEDSDRDGHAAKHAVRSASSHASAADAASAAASTARPEAPDTAAKKKKKKKTQNSAGTDSVTAAPGVMKPRTKPQRNAPQALSDGHERGGETPGSAAKSKKSKKSKQQATAAVLTAEADADAAQRAAKTLRKEKKRAAKETKRVQKRADIDGDDHIDGDVAFASGDDLSGSDFEQDMALAAGFVLVDLETEADELAVLADLASAGRLSTKALRRLATHELKKSKQALKDKKKQRKQQAKEQADERIAFPISAAATGRIGVVSWDSDGDDDDRVKAPVALTPEQLAAKADAKRLKQKAKRKQRRSTAAAAAAIESVSETTTAAAVASTSVSDLPRPVAADRSHGEKDDVTTVQAAATASTPLVKTQQQKKKKERKEKKEKKESTSQETAAAAEAESAAQPRASPESRTDDTAPSRVPQGLPVVSKKAAKRAAKEAQTQLEQQKQALKTERRSERGRRNKHVDADAADEAADEAAAPGSRVVDVTKRPSGAAVYEEYVRRDIVLLGLEAGAYFQGRLRVNAKYRMDGYVTVDGIPIDVLVKGMEDRNRAFDGDVVAIELLPETAWKPLKDDSDKKKTMATSDADAAVPTAPTPPIDATKLHALWRPSVEVAKCIVSRSSESTDAAAASALSTRLAAIAATAASQQLRPTAKVVHVLAHGDTQGFIGSLEPKTKLQDADAPLASDDAFAYFNAHDERLPRWIQIPRLQLPDEFVRHPLTYSKTILCFCRIKTWSTKYMRPMGEFVKTLGEFNGIESGIAGILTKHGLLSHTLDFASDILDDLDATYGVSGEKWTIPASEVATRRDFRATHQIFSIDPYNARDLDDALHIRALNPERSQFEVGVHIADVTHFIQPGSALDKEAQARATSVYLVNRVLPMLPRVLCEKLCSLQPQVDRLAFSVVWHMNADGTLVDGTTPWFGKSIIRSCCKLDYGSAQKMLDGAITSDDVALWEEDRRPIAGANPRITNASVIQSVKDLWAVGQRRRKSRFDTGAISLNSVKLVFSLDAAGNPTTFGSYELKDSNRLVEEYMLLANYLVAQQLLRAHGPLAFIRNHPEPASQALEQALATLQDHALALDATSPKSLYDSMEHVRATHGELTYVITQAMLIKPMQPAEYMVAGNGASPDAWRHYALNIPYYTHFTSPIRRYADVVVHRLLFESLTSGDVLPVDNPDRDVAGMLQALTAVSQTCNDKKMTAKHAETECDLVFLCAYVKHHGAVNVTGVVMSMGPQSFTVYVLELGLEERIALKDVGWSGEWDDKASRLAIRKRVKAKKKPKRKTQESDAAAGADSAASVVAPPSPPAIQLAFMKKLRLEMSATVKMPLKLVFSVVGECPEVS